MFLPRGGGTCPLAPLQPCCPVHEDPLFFLPAPPRLTAPPPATALCWGAPLAPGGGPGSAERRVPGWDGRRQAVLIQPRWAALRLGDGIFPWLSLEASV